MRCNNCGQTVLETDTICWHCGWELPRQETKKPAPKPVAKLETLPDISLSGIGVYGGLTAVLLLLLLLVMRSLGNKPFVIISPESKQGWAHITDQQMRFTFDLPPEWLWVEKGNETQAMSFEEVLEQNSRFSAVLASLPGHSDETELLIVAVQASFEQNEGRFGLVARVPHLHPLSAEEVVKRMQETIPQVTVIEAAVTENLLGQPQAHIILELDMTDELWKCQQDIVRGQSESYLVAACATEDEYPRRFGELEDILYSFQPLQ